MASVRDHRWYGLAVGVYLALAALLVLLNYRYQRHHLLEGIDRNLLVVASAVPHILPDDFHDRADGPDAISPAEDRRNQELLTDYAGVTGVHWVWTDVEREGRFFITACNRTEQSEQPNLATDYWVEYPTMAAAQRRAFRGTKPVFDTFTDKWGTFRAVFVPSVSPGGKRYLACAEYELAHVEAELRDNALRAVFAAMLLLLAVTPLLWLNVRQTRRHHRRLAAANEELEQARSHLATILDAIDDAVLATGRDGRIRWANDTAHRWLSENGNSLAGEALDVVVALSETDGGTRLPGPWSLLTEPGCSLPDRDLLLRAAGGRSLTVETAAAHLADAPDGRAESRGEVVFVLRDVTRQRELEATMRQSQKLETVGRLAGGVAHDFNNLLMTILASAEFLQEEFAEGSTARADVDRIRAAGRRAAELTRQLLVFSRRSSDAPQVIDLHDVIAEATVLLRHSLDRSIELRVATGATRSRVLGVPAQLSSALMNLGLNARDAMPAGGRLSFVTRDAGPDDPEGSVVLEVEDSGHGIPAETLEHIFEPFFTTKPLGSGTGLGLAVVYSTVREMDGDITVHSEPGRGTRVRLVLPLTTREVTAPAPRQPTSPTALRGLRILVVDDEPDIRDVAARALRRYGAQVDEAADGVEAERQLADGVAYDLVMLDIVMPVRDGLETLPIIRDRHPCLPVLLCSGYDPLRKAGELANADGVGYLPKPYTREAMVAAIQTLLS